MRVCRFGFVLCLLLVLAALTVAACAQTNRVSFSTGSWTPNDSSEWKDGKTYQITYALDRSACRLAFGSVDDASSEDLGSFDILQFGFDYRVKPLTTKKGAFDWYAGIGVDYTSISQSQGFVWTGDTYAIESISDSAIGPALSLGFYIANLGVEVRRSWGKDSVDIGGTSVGLSWVW